MRKLMFFFLGLSALCAPEITSAQNTGEFARTTIDLPADREADAIAYGPDGRLFVLTQAQNSILAIGPQGLDGSETVINLAGSLGVDQVAAATFDQTRGRLLVAGSRFGGSPSGSIFSIDTSTGAFAELFSGSELGGVSEVAVRSTGEIFASNFGFSGTGGIFLIDDTTGTGTLSATEVVGNLDGAAGLVFDANNNLIFQNGNDGTSDGSGDFTAEISLLGITDTAAGLQFDSAPTLLAQNSTGEIDLIIDGEGDFFTTGTLGLYQLDRDASGNLTGTETRLLSDLDLDFSSGLAFLPGSVAFDSNLTIAPGDTSPVLSFVSDSTSRQIISLSLNVAAVPEPTAIPLGMLLVLQLMRRRNRTQ